MTSDGSIVPPEILSPDEAVQRFYNSLIQPARLLVAISGGSDSSGLLLALSKFRSAAPAATLFAVTVDHRLRPESSVEARSVADLCARLQIPHTTKTWDGAKPATGLSAASREARYRLLLEAAEEIDATAILTGHTLEDQAETIAMRAARNVRENAMGLAGMAQAVLLDRRRWLLRPFLMTRRQAIRDFLRSEACGWIDDPSNENMRYERVRVRNPAPGFDLAAWRLAVSRRTRVSDLAASLMRTNLDIRHGVLSRMGINGLKGDREVLRYGLSSLTALLGGRAFGPGSDVMDRIMDLLEKGEPGRMTAGRVFFDLRRDVLYMMRESRGLMPTRVRPGETAVWDGRFAVANRGKDEISVLPTTPSRKEALALFPDAPPAIATRAMAAMPHIEGNWADVEVKPMLGPFDRFLPHFDLKLAATFAKFVACDNFPGLPVKDFERKS